MDQRHPSDAPISSPATPIRPTESEGRALTPEEMVVREPNPVKRFLRLLGPGIITGAADDDPSAIATYAKAGASFGPGILWLAPVTLLMMAAVVFLCAKVGMVSGMGLAGVLRQHYPRWLLYPTVVGILIANLIEAGADIGAMAAALNLFVPIPASWMIVPITLIMLALQAWGSYRLIQRLFKWLTLALFAYAGAAYLAQPNLREVLEGTFLPTVRFESQFLSVLVAVVGTTLSPYLYFWQASQAVEEEVAMGRRRLWQRQGASTAELSYAAWDVNIGMFFSNLVMYFIMLSTASTLFKAGQTDIQSAADAAQALRPLAGNAAGVLFALGVVGVGFIAVPVLTTGAAYALAETFRWRHGLDEQPGRAKHFYSVIAMSTLVAMSMNFIGLNVIDALFWAAVIMGLLAPPLMLVVMLITNNRTIMGDRVNGLALNVLGWASTVAVFAAALALMWRWGMP
jgi:NRAMP (natural resistance-associated macrophage protein)-like metal ion transporter